MNKLLIGVGGYKRHGKNLVAMGLENVLPNTKILAFADPLKMEVAQQLATIDVNEDRAPDWASRVKFYFAEMNSEEIDPNTGRAIKENYRLITQWWGTEWRRKQDENYWINKYQEEFLKDDQHQFFIAPDCRFPNEDEFIHKMGGILLKVERPILGKPNDMHESEAYVDSLNYDWIFENTSSIEELLLQVGDYATRNLINV